jgi:hypothetical protein
MPNKNPRVNAVLEEPLFRTVETLARREGVSLSQKVRDLVREAVELVEDEGLEAIVEKRRASGRGRWITHAEVQRRLKIS